MRKFLILLLTIVLVSPLNAFADENPKVLTLEASTSGDAITFEGTTEDNVYAVMCKLYDEDTVEINTLSVAVYDDTFEGTFTIKEAGEYEVACANYEGGAIVRDTATMNEVVPTTYTVTFNTNGGSNIEPATVDAGATVTEPENPTKGDLNFIGWYQDEILTTPFDFTTPITDNTILYAKWADPPVTIYTVSFNTNGGGNIPDAEIPQGDTVEEPEDPINGNLVFAGWYADETLTTPFDFTTPITDNIVLYAKWEEAPGVPYDVPDGSGNSISFYEEEGHEYNFAILDLSNLSDEELFAVTDGEITKEEYDAALEVLKDAVSSEGTFVAIYEIIVVDENDVEKEEGPFTIKIKKTPEMEKYNSFKLLYVDTDNNFNIEETIDLTEDADGNLVGTLQHLSSYVLVGNNVSSNTNNPQTLDNIYIWIVILLISFVGLAISALSARKLQSKKNK